MKTIFFCRIRSTDNRYVEMNREIEFPGFIPIGYNIFCSPDDDMTIRDAFYSILDGRVHAVLGDSCGNPLEGFSPRNLIEMATNLSGCGFAILDDRPPDGEPTMASILAAKEQP